MIATVRAANSHLPTVDVWEHFYLHFSSSGLCDSRDTDAIFCHAIDRISFFFFDTAHPTKAGFAK